MIFNVYRMYDAAGALLYVGHSITEAARIAAHSHDLWWHEVKTTKHEPHPTREAMLAAEIRAIKIENPKYNIVYREPIYDPADALSRIGDVTDPIVLPRHADDPLNYGKKTGTLPYCLNTLLYFLKHPQLIRDHPATLEKMRVVADGLNSILAERATEL